MSRISKDMRPKFLRVIIAILIFIAIFIFCTVYFRKNIVPTVMDSSIAQVRAITTNAINLAATTVINGGLTYDELFEVKKDNNGKITMIQANSPRINTIAREIANLAQANLDALGTQEISISVGTFTGLALLTGFGPDVTIKIVPIGTANCDFVSYFQSAGINQTLHKIYIDVYADVNIITPIDEPTVQVKAEILVCENVIVGEVPEFYLNMSDISGMLNLNP
ncbi:MAG: sporulation protein YunB [Clostridia bacterium]|nr:sporulation protein YunB [Clostridia bacterium]